MADDKPQENQYTIFVDLDGVLFDWHSAILKAIRDDFESDFVYDQTKYNTDRKYRDKMWKFISDYQKKHGPILWRNLDLLPDAHVLWNYLKPYHPQILTATGQERYHAAEQKRAAVTQHFGSNVRVNTVQTAANKQQHAGPNRILIDDTPRAIQPWVAAGGIGILHTSAANTIKQLKELGL